MQKKNSKPFDLLFLENGRGERIRTSGLTVPNGALYQTEPRPVNSNQSVGHCPNYVKLRFLLLSLQTYV